MFSTLAIIFLLSAGIENRQYLGTRVYVGDSINGYQCSKVYVGDNINEYKDIEEYLGDTINQYQGNKVHLKDDINKQEEEAEQESTYVGTLRTWAENSNTTGISNIERSKHPIRIIIWIILVCAGAGR